MRDCRASLQNAEGPRLLRSSESTEHFRPAGRLADKEGDELTNVIKELSGTSQKVRRAQVLLKSDVNGPAWTDAKIADEFNCRTKTVESIRQRLVESGLRETLDGKKRITESAR